MDNFFLFSKLLSPFLSPLGFFLILFWVFFIFKKFISNRIWVFWGCTFWLFSTSFFSDILLSIWEEPLGHFESVEPFSYDAIIVLGGMVRGLAPEEGQILLGSSSSRLMESLRLYKKKTAPFLLVTGGDLGVFSANQWREADGMLDFFSLAGVPVEKILIEDQARNTYENAFYSKPLLESIKGKKFLLVTSAFHMKRSLAIFNKISLEVTPYSVDSRRLKKPFPFNFLPSVEALALSSTVMREMIGFLAYWWKGYL